MKQFLYILVTQLLCLSGISQDVQIFQEQTIFTNGTDGYGCFRIPAVIKASNGDLLAFAEGRVSGCNDFGDVDIVLKRSEDNGKSWSSLEVVADNGSLQSGNPAPVEDLLDPRYKSGRIFLVYNNGIASEHETRLGDGLRTVLYTTSTNYGKTWSDPIDITLSVHKPLRPDINNAYNFKEDWRSYANTPGHAIQLKKGKYKGRLLIPANHSEGEPISGFNDYRAHAFYSDDHGATWQLSSNVDVPSSNESIAVELPDGGIMQNIRQQNGETRQRLVAKSNDGGATWSEIYFDSTLISPVCQASMISHQLSTGQEVILFSNPESKNKRENLTIKMSFDNGQSWPVKRVARTGESAYSDLVIQEDDRIGILYEHGNNEGIHYASLNMAWLTGGENYNKKGWVKKIIAPGVVQTNQLKLSKPIPRFASTLFQKNVTVTYDLDYRGTKIFYTTDGSTPNTSSRLYSDELTIDQSCTLKAIAVHPDTKNSDISSTSFIKVSQLKDVNKVSLSRKPSAKYPGGGPYSLFDMIKGTTNFSNGEWMGFEGGSIQVHVSLKNIKKISNVKLSVLSANAQWIFLPSEIIIEAEGRSFTKNMATASKKEAAGSKFIEIPLDNILTDELQITIKALEEIPEWHQGKGTPAWLFIDEIIVE